MPYRYLFATHAKLQELLAVAYVRTHGLPREEVLLLCNRGSYNPRATYPFAALDADRYQATSGVNWPHHRWRNHRRQRAFHREVLAVSAPDVRIFSAMYTYWYLRQLRERAAAYYILEDGLGSYHDRADLVGRSAPTPAPSPLTQLCRTEEQLGGHLPLDDLLDGATGYVSSSPDCFPWVAPDRHTVLENVYSPLLPGQYDGATVLVLSAFVEQRMVDLAAYCGLLTTLVADLPADRAGHYYKLHPMQAAGPHAARYRDLLTGAGLKELEQSVSLERLAAGNDLTLVTGISTLGLHAAALGRTVYSYRDRIEPLLGQGSRKLRGRAFDLYREVTRPL